MMVSTAGVGGSFPAPPLPPSPMHPPQLSPPMAGPSAPPKTDVPTLDAPIKPAKPVVQTAPGTLNGPPSGNNHAIPLSARRAEPFDLSTVERRGQLTMVPEPPKRERMFGIPDAPTFRPTEEEFRDPMEYIRKIAPEGRKYGVAKIIPPDSWNPPFAINTERFHFRTRRQELSSVEGGNRVNNDYLDQLARFHKQNGHNLNRFPSVDKRPLDLYRLKKTVERKGGFESVCKGKRWAEVGRDLGYSGKIMSSLSTSLKNSYQKWLLPYEEYLRLAKPGVHQQMEMLNGGPYTPSPGPSPAKHMMANSPPGFNHDTPPMRATAALHTSINGPSPHAHPPPSSVPSGMPSTVPPEPQIATPLPAPQPSPSQAQPAPPTSGGFTPVNPGGFTAVNVPPPSSSFTSVNVPPPSSSFTSVNGAHSNSATPQRPTDTPPVSFSSQQIAPYPSTTPTLKRQHSEVSLSQDEIDAINRRSKRLRVDVPTVAGSNMHHSRMSAARMQPLKDRGNFRPGDMCEHCGKADDRLKFVTCQTCDAAYHMYCLEPPLKQYPDYDWHCPKCLVGTSEYGFEEGDVYSLVGFQRKAREFKQFHFNSLAPQHTPFQGNKRHLDEFDVEREFWRLVENINDSTEVEYGADIHSTTHGSGFPTIEKQPRDPYSADPWNLNILPLDKESLFRHIKSDISGMTVPWLYVGMVFSTFCWHNEDHYAYSANYQHFGETKTWYGIPAEDTEKFEAAMREEVPELFEMQPDILFQLVTLAKPEKLINAGVRVYSVDQRAGQFVITFPQAYHAGFNHGFNFNEAVNFAPADWEPYGEKGAKRMRDYRKQPCFSHDELLLSASTRDHTIRTAKWLAPALERMRDEELAARKHFLSGPESEPTKGSKEPYAGPRWELKPEIIDAENEEDEISCSFCKSYCYLSRFKCLKTAKYLCPLHAGNYECCDALEHERYQGRDGTHTLHLRQTDDALDKIVSKVVEKASIPETWQAKVDGELDENPRPSLKHLRTLVSEGEKIQYELPGLSDLRRFVEKCNEWVEEATVFITRKQQNRRKNEKSGRKSYAKAQEAEEREKELRNLDNIHRLLESADEISFDCNEISILRERSENIKEFRREANLALENINTKTTEEFQELADRGRDFHVDIPEIELLEATLKRLRWNDRVVKMKPIPGPIQGKQDHDLDDIETFIAEGREVGVREDNPDLDWFIEHKATGELWEEKAQEVMAAEPVHYQQLDSLSRQAVSLAVRAETRAKVDAILKKHREVQEKIQALVERAKDPEFRQRPKYKEVKEVMDIVEELQSKPPGTTDLEKEQRKHEDWMRRGKKLFGKANAPLHILLQHMNQVMERNDSCFEISDKLRAPAEPASRHVTPADDMPISDGSNSSREVFCICRKSEAGMMIECEHCREWYHGKCLKIARGKVKEEDKYTCPICDWRVKIPRDAARPKLDDLQAWREDLPTLPFQPDEEDTLARICDHAQEYRDFVKPIVQPGIPTSPGEVDTMRFHLRKIEGADILLMEETNFLRQELHKWAPVAPTAPPILEQSGSTRKPRPTKQQKLMAQLGVTNPDDLPHEYKIKPHVAKRKASEAMTKGQMPLQPAETTASPIDAPTPSAYPPPPGSANGTPKDAPKRFLTPLALHVLDQLCEAPVVSQMLKNEPHMNRDKLTKMKILLEGDHDHSLWDDLETFKRKMKEMPTPSAHTSSAFAFDELQRQPGIRGSSGHRDSPLFQTTSNNPYPMTEQHRNQFDSPAGFGTPPDYPGHNTSPTHHAFDPNMFDGPSGSMFDSPSLNDNKPPTTDVEHDFAGGPSRMFESPKMTSAPAFGSVMGMGSPGFGGSQPSNGGNIDHVFDDLVHDHEIMGTLGVMDGAPGGQDSKGVPVEDGISAAGPFDTTLSSFADSGMMVDPQMSGTATDQMQGGALQQLAEQGLGIGGFQE